MKAKQFETKGELTGQGNTDRVSAKTNDQKEGLKQISTINNRAPTFEAGQNRQSSEMTPRGEGTAGTEQDLIGTLLMDDDELLGGSALYAKSQLF